uniref:SNARE n=1 Tax=Trepomonas sp. PC1 TaxID=1076344 RepID=A0A146KHM9_9EUKA|eukprot:JAP96250.1 hypothetical protein TPC1_10474 [Trepomonas sp. PC1]
MESVQQQIDQAQKNLTQFEKTKSNQNISVTRQAINSAEQQLQQVIAALKNIPASEKQKFNPKVTQITNNITNLKSKMTLVDNIPIAVSAEQRVAQQAANMVAQTEDSKRLLNETNQTGKEIVTNIKKQNNQMMDIDYTTGRIQGNIRESEELVKLMKRKEKCVNLSLWLFVVVLIGIDAFVMWWFHRT